MEKGYKELKSRSKNLTINIDQLYKDLCEINKDKVYEQVSSLITISGKSHNALVEVKKNKKENLITYDLDKMDDELKKILQLFFNTLYKR